MNQFSFSSRSKRKLATCHPDLIRVMELAIHRTPIDFGISEGHRSLETQQGHFNAVPQRSKCDGINNKSKHQSLPSNAVDVYAFIGGKVSYKICHLSLLAGTILAAAQELGIELTWGGEFGSQDFSGWDMPHYEIRSK